MLDVVLDMETSDPDDFLTLLLLLGHPRVNLRAVTITPGTPDQVGVVRAALSWFEKDIPVGVYDLDHQPKSEKTRDYDGEGDDADKRSGRCVSAWHYRAYGDLPASRDAEPGAEVLHRVCTPETTLLTGAPLKNLGAAMKLPGFRVGRLVAQGGFAGEGVVPPEKQLPKFQGRRTCPTFNLNGDPKSALAALSFAGIGTRRFVSKNVCHGVIYDAALHHEVTQVKDRSRSLGLIWQGMDSYLKRNAEGKAFHDPLAACCAIDERIGTWAEVELYRERGEWGARLSPGSNTWIIVDYDRTGFLATLLAT